MNDPTPPAEAAPIVGTEVAPPAAAVVPSPAQQTVMRERAVGRTAVQVGLPSALVTIAAWLAALNGWDMSPDPDETAMPEPIVAAWIVVATVAMARWMNRPPADSSAGDSGRVDVVTALMVFVLVVLILWLIGADVR